MDRVEFRRRVEEAIRSEIPLSVWPPILSLNRLTEQIMIAHDEAVEAALEEYENSEFDPEMRSSLECDEDVALHILDN